LTVPPGYWTARFVRPPERSTDISSDSRHIAMPFPKDSSAAFYRIAVLPIRRTAPPAASIPVAAARAVLPETFSPLCALFQTTRCKSHILSPPANSFSPEALSTPRRISGAGAPNSRKALSPAQADDNRPSRRCADIP